MEQEEEKEMKTAKQVDELIAQLKNSGIPLSDAAWQAALACVGWPYIFGDRGQLCTPAHRRAAYNSKGQEHPTIKTKCKNFEGTGSCSGCTFYPGGQTRANDCRGFTYWILLQIYGWKLQGAGATSQWNTETNWKAKGEISTMPKDTLCCLFVRKGKTMEHTGFGLNNETVECSNGVQHFTSRNKKWTHWAVPACVGEKAQDPTTAPADPDPEPGTVWRPTIRRGSRNTYVKECQTMLSKLGYSLGICGIDGDFGSATLAAVQKFQQEHGLIVDGVVGPMTWDALEKAVTEKNQEQAESVKTYSVTITGLDLTQAQAFLNKYPGAVITEGSEGK
jgi:hypothetical protein